MDISPWAVVMYVSSANIPGVYGGPQLSQQKQKPHGKTKNLTVKTKYLTTKPKPSRQNQRPHGETKYFTAKAKYLSAKANTHGKTKAILFLLWSIWFCREVFGFAVTVVGHHKGSGVARGVLGCPWPPLVGLLLSKQPTIFRWRKRHDNILAVKAIVEKPTF